MRINYDRKVSCFDGSVNALFAEICLTEDGKSRILLNAKSRDFNCAYINNFLLPYNVLAYSLKYF